LYIVARLNSNDTIGTHPFLRGLGHQFGAKGIAGPGETCRFKVEFWPTQWGGLLTRYSATSVEELVRACAKSNDSAAWEEFVNRFHRPISLSVIRATYQWGEFPQQVVDDLVQETYLKLFRDKCRLLLDFTGQHPEAVLGYIKTIALNVTHDHFKALHTKKRGSGETDQLLEGVDPPAQNASLHGPDAMERAVLLKQIDRCLDACSEGPDQERDRLIFWLYYQQGISAKGIAALPTVGLTAKGVESAIFRLTRLVREQIVQLRSDSSAQPGEEGFRPAESY
jgi:RNA polymerase sigma-70 factor (ECF subfamily)